MSTVMPIEPILAHTSCYYILSMNLLYSNVDEIYFVSCLVEINLLNLIIMTLSCIISIVAA